MKKSDAIKRLDKLNKNDLLDYLFVNKYKITQQKARNKKTGDAVIVYTATNDKKKNGLAFAYNTNTKKIENLIDFW